MAIYHLEAKIVTRGIGRTACGAAAYMSCSRIYNDYDGIQHDYTRKSGLVWEHVFLPSMAPTAWHDRETLWNAVEEGEKTKDSRLAREFIAALPVELGKEQWVSLLTEFIQNNFVADGMCADISVHDTDGHNPHAHILLTVRPLNEDGTWQYKTEKEYLCVRDGEERGFTSAEFKAAKTEGWEKQYPYKVGKKKVYMAPSAAEAQGLEHASKYPKATRYGRQNPISERWNSEEQLTIWREKWADTVNRALEEAERPERIDHRSHAERALDEKPTIHEGYEARKMEKMGFVSERCELNRQIRRDNAVICYLKAKIRALMQEVLKPTIETAARIMETARQKIIEFTYGILHNGDRRDKVEEYLGWAKPAYQEYISLRKTIKDKVKERKGLKDELAALPQLNIARRRELKDAIAKLTSEIDSLRPNADAAMSNFGKRDATEMETVKTEIANAEASIKKLNAANAGLSDAADKAKSEFDGMKEQAAGLDEYELTDARLAIRPQMESEAHDHISERIGRTASGGIRIVCALQTSFSARRAWRRVTGNRSESRSGRKPTICREKRRKNGVKSDDVPAPYIYWLCLFCAWKASTITHSSCFCSLESVSHSNNSFSCSSVSE